MINGSNYIFKNKIGRVVTWDFLLNLMPELKNILVVDIVELTKILIDTLLNLLFRSHYTICPEST